MSNTHKVTKTKSWQPQGLEGDVAATEGGLAGGWEQALEQEAGRECCSIPGHAVLGDGKHHPKGQIKSLGHNSVGEGENPAAE